MFRNISFGAVAALAIGALAVGCSDDGDTVITGGSLTTDNFPGSSIQASNVAEDGRAFTNQGQNITNDDLTIYWSPSGTAIALYNIQTAAGSFDQLLMAAYFDGATWQPSVQIRGENENTNSSVDGFKVLWLNTSGSTEVTGNTAGRNGDAIILFVRSDRDPVFPNGATVNEDANDRLYGSYFDVSAASAPASGTVIGGFQTLATAIDDDNVITALDDPDVSTFGFASDSLRYSHEFTSGVDPVDSGDPTTFVHFVWRKDPASGTPTDLGERYNSIQFNLAQVGNAMPAASPSDVIDVAGQGTNTENVNGTLVVHNGHAFYDVTGLSDLPGLTDQILIGEVFSTAAASSQFELGSTQLNDSADASFQPSARNVVGADHGLAGTYFVFEETGFNDDSVDGNRSQDRDLMLGELQISATGVTTYSGPVEIDAHTGTLDDDDTDGDTVAVRDGTNGDVSQDSAELRLNRTGTYFSVVWLQENDDVTDINAGDINAGALVVNIIPFVTVVQTRIDSADPRVLTNSISTVEELGALSSNRELLGTASGTNGGNNAKDLTTQATLAQGQAVSQSEDTANRGCSFQGNNLRMAYLFTQNGENLTASTLDEATLFLASAVTTLGVAATDAPTIAVTTNDVETADTGYFGGNFNAAAVDAGDNSTTGSPPVATTSAGRVLVFFNSQENNEFDDTASGAFNEFRFYVSEEGTTGVPGAKVLMSTNPNTGFQLDAFQLYELQGAELVPVNEDTVNSPNHVGTTLHVYWTERRNLPGSNRRLATRSHSQASVTAATVVAFADQFTPPLHTSASASTVSTTPAFIDLPTDGSLTTLSGSSGDEFFTARNGNTVGVYFSEDDHIYYQETSGTADGYITSNGVADPQLVDNDSLVGIRVFGWELVTPPECNNLSKSMVLFARDDASQSGSGFNGQTAVRVYIRVHN